VKFPEDHFFILITRPFVEWTFKVFAWLIFTSTIQFAYQKTGSQVLFYLKWTCYTLLLAFTGAFVDWVLEFRRYRAISGEKLSAAANVSASSSLKRISWLRRVGRKTRKAIAAVISIIITITLIGISNFAIDKVIEALIEFQQQVK
jgi:hypothetical protein